ncbi:Cuticle protein 10.9 [Sarcoptes scabiei]|uniref:Cuticle protein 10.9 n=1 Tax=Sarcoptes scabiei TaxID=52283 RepID=A0A834RCN9_SARSC|nr:Cuticle protein 10.9 [Sarcoptes scabiei]
MAIPSHKLTMLMMVMIVWSMMTIDQFECGYHHGHHHGDDDGGHHEDYGHHYPPHPYKFGYEIDDGYGGKNSRHETGDDYGTVHGSYSLHDKDGRKRIVEYIADKKGFRAKIHSNEPGLQSHKAAHAYYDVEHHGYHGGGDDDDHYDHGGYGGHGYENDYHN